MTDRNVLLRPRATPLVAPSILASDFARLADDARHALEAGGDLLHLDVMDGHFVPNLSMGPAICGKLRAALPHACLDVHLMVTDPAEYIEPFGHAGADHITFHVEANGEPQVLVEAIRNAGMSAGIALSPQTSADEVLPFLSLVDMFLVMSVNPGFGGQAFLPDTLDATRALSAARASADGWGPRIQMDGGVNAETAASCRDAGCDVLVAGSAIFGTADYAAAITAVRGGSHGATSAPQEGAGRAAGTPS